MYVQSEKAIERESEREEEGVGEIGERERAGEVAEALPTTEKYPPPSPHPPSPLLLGSACDRAALTRTCGGACWSFSTCGK